MTNHCAPAAGSTSDSGSAAELLRTDRADELIREALAASGLQLQEALRTNWFSRPGAETSAIYQVRASGAQLHLIVSTVELSAAQRRALGAVRLDGEGGSFHIWAHPADPELPGLPGACDPAALSARVSAVFGAAATVTELRMRVLRPLRRAVLEADVVTHGVRGRLFVKVVPPARAPLLMARHRLCPQAPAAHEAGEGIVLIEVAAGRSLTAHLYRPGGDARPVPQISAAKLLGAMDDVDPAAADLPRRAAPAQRVSSYTTTCLRAGAPPERVRALQRWITASLLPEPGPLTVTHGDLHGANIFLDDAGMDLTGLIDVDTLGPGYQADDAACLISHLLTLPSISPAGYGAALPLAEEVWTHARSRHDPEDLQARCAAVLMSLIPGARTRHHLFSWLRTAETIRTAGMAEALRGTASHVSNATGF